MQSKMSTFISPELYCGVHSQILQGPFDDSIDFQSIELTMQPSDDNVYSCPQTNVRALRHWHAITAANKRVPWSAAARLCCFCSLPRPRCTCGFGRSPHLQEPHFSCAFPTFSPTRLSTPTTLDIHGNVEHGEIYGQFCRWRALGQPTRLALTIRALLSLVRCRWEATQRPQARRD